MGSQAVSWQTALRVSGLSRAAFLGRVSGMLVAVASVVGLGSSGAVAGSVSLGSHPDLASKADGSSLSAKDSGEPAGDPKGRPSAGRKRGKRTDRRTTPVRRAKGKKVEIPADVQKQIDEMVGRKPAQGADAKAKPPAPPADNRNRANRGVNTRPVRTGASPKPGAKLPGATTKPTTGTARSQPTSGASEPTTPIDMPPAEDAIPAEDRMYSFSIKGGSYEQLLAGLNRQTGLAIVGDAPKNGKVTFVTEEELTFDGLLERVRELLFEYSPLEHYWLIRKPTHLEVINVNDYYRKLEPHQIYQSVELYKAAQLADYELAMVIYTPTGSISDLNTIRNFMPDYVMVAPLEKRNAITIYALVKDIEKYLQLIEIFSPHGTTSHDIRPLAVIKVEHVEPTEAWVAIQSLMELDSTAAPVKARRARRPAAQSGGVLDSMPEPQVSVVPSDEQGVLIVRAMQDKIDEIKMLLPLIDVDSSERFEPVVVPLEFVSAEDMIPILEQILNASGPTSSGGHAQTPKRGARPKKRKRGRSARGATSASVGGTSLLAHPSGSALIVIGPDETVATIRRLVKEFDKDTETPPVFIPLAHTDTAELETTVTRILLPGADGPKGSPKRFSLVPDPAGRGVWFTGSGRDLEKVRDVIAAVDQVGHEILLHVIKLERRLPSFVVTILAQYDAAAGGPGGGSSASPKRTRAAPRGAAAKAGKFTPDDENMRLFVLCTDSEWETYQGLIEELELQVEAEAPQFVTIPARHISAEELSAKLQNVVGRADGKPRGPGAVRFETTDGGVIVFGADVKQIEQLETVAEVFDVEKVLIQRTFEIIHVDPSVVVGAVEALVMAAPKPNKGPRGSKGVLGSSVATPEVTIIPVGNRLVVRATEEKMVEIDELVRKFDVDHDARSMRIYSDFAPSVDVEKVAEQLRSFILSGKNRVRRPDGVQSDGPQIVAQPEVHRVLVIAAESDFQEIEEMVEVLSASTQVPVFDTALVGVHFADPAEVVELVKPLLNMKADALVAQGVLTGTPGGAAPGGKRRSGRAATGRTPARTEWFHLEADVRRRRIVVAAPEALMGEAKALIAKFDDKGDEGDSIDLIVELANATAADMVKTIREMMGKPNRAPRSVGKVGAASQGELALGEFTVVAAPGDRAVVLRGMPELVEQAANWITELDSLPGGAREVKVYSLECARAARLTDFIMEVVGKPKAGSKTARSQRPRRPNEEEEEEDPFETKLKRTGEDIYLEADLIANVLVVAATPIKLAEVDALVDKFDDCENGGPIPEELSVPKFTYELEYSKDAIEAAMNLEMVLDDFWTGSEVPRVDSAIWGDYLVIEYPYENRFDEIRKLIREYVDVEDPDTKQPKRLVLTPPQGIGTAELAALLQTNNPHLKINIVDRTRKRAGDDEERRVRPLNGRSRPCALPLSVTESLASLSALLAAVDAATWHAGRAADPVEEKGPRKGGRSRADATRGEPKITKKDPPQKTGGEPTERPTRPRSRATPATADPNQPEVKIYFDAELQQIIIEGLPDQVSEIEDTFEQLKEEIEEFTPPPDIRIYRVKYIDVNTAASIIDEMFNASRQERLQFQQQQRQQAQRIRQQQRQQQRQNQQRGAEGNDPQGRGGQRGQQRGNQPQPTAPQLPGTIVRVTPNPRDRTLILRADSSQYPALLELLATIDQPQPMESSFRTFPLKKLNAVEVEEVLTSMLGLDALSQRSRRPSSAGQRGRAGRGGRGGRGSRGASAFIEPGGQLPKMIQQETAAGMLGIDPDDIKLSSNEEANTILAMAPEAALDYIADIIQQLEDQQIEDRIWRTYDLRHADADGVVTYLEETFGGAAPDRGGRRKDKGGSGVGRRKIDAPTFVAYARLNRVSAQGTEAQLKEVDTIIGDIDVRSDANQFQTIELTRADALQVAERLTEMFGGTGSASGGRKPRGRQSGRRVDSGSATGAKFMGKEGGRIVFYSAPKSLRPEILAAVEQMEADSAQTEPRTIQLTSAKPSTVATAIREAYGGSSSGLRGGKRTASQPARFTISAHDPSQRLFVVAGDDLFEEISRLAATMDQPADPGFDFRVFKLQFADAKKVYGQLSGLMTDYLRQLRGGGEVEPFSVDVDEKANALVVLGSPAIFEFLEQKLPMIDIPANAASPPGFLMVQLKSANAQEVAQNINQLWTARDIAEGETPPQAQANRTTNTLIVKGTQEQVDEIKKQFIDPLEANAQPKLLTEVFDLAHAQPEAVADSINRMYDDLKKVNQLLGRDSNVSPIEFAVIATPDVNTKQVIVQAGEKNMEKVRLRIAHLDKPENAASTAVAIRVYSIKYADVNAVANIIKDWARSRSQNRSVSASEMVTAVAEGGTQSVVVTASELNQATVAEMITALDNEDNATLKRQQHVLALHYANSNELANHFTQIFRNMATLRRGDRGPAFVSEANSNSLIASVNERELVEVQRLVDQLDVEPALDNLRSTEVYPLKYADPGSLNAVVLNMFRWDRRGAASPAEQVTSAVDWGTRSVIVTASKKNHAIVGAMIEKADVESAETKQNFVYMLKNASATDVANTLREALRSRRRTGRGEEPVSVVADAASDKLVISASSKEYEELVKLIEQLDTEDAVSGEVRVVTLSYGDATEMQRALQEALRKQGGRGQELTGGVRISALAQSNSLVLSGSKTKLDELDARIKEMDAAGAETSQPKMIRLTHAKVGRLLPTLQEMFLEQRGGGRGRNQVPTSITANEPLNAVFVKAGPKDMAAIESVIADLDNEQLAKETSFRLVSVAGGYNLNDLAIKIEDAVNAGQQSQGRGRNSRQAPRVTITPDTRSNQLIVAGDSVLFDEAEQLAQMLAEAKPGSGTGVTVIQLKKRKVDEIQRLIDQLTQQGAGGGRSGQRGRATSGRRSSGNRARSGSSSRRPSSNRRPSRNRR